MILNTILAVDGKRIANEIYLVNVSYYIKVFIMNLHLKIYNNLICAYLRTM